MEKKEEARIKDKKIQELVRLPADSKFKNLSACWRIHGTYSAPSGLNAFKNVLFKGLHPLLAIAPRWG